MTTQALLAVAATISAFGVLIAAVIAIYKIAKRIDDALGLDKDGRTIAERLDRVEHQLWENGGSSLADRVNNIEKHVVKVSTEVEFIKDLTMGLHAAQTGQITNVYFPSENEPLVKPVVKQVRKRKAS
jgi:hypothetical protein